MNFYLPFVGLRDALIKGRLKNKKGQRNKEK